MAPESNDQEERIDQHIELKDHAQVGKIIQIGSLKIDLSSPGQMRRLWLGGSAAFVALAALIVVTFLLLRSELVASARKPGGPLSGVFNVAVLPFRQLTDDGLLQPSAYGETLAEQVYDALKPVEAALNQGEVKTFEVRFPAEFEAPELELKLEDLESQVERLASGLHADLVIYGYLEPGDKSLHSLLYIDGQRLPNAEDLQGHYPFGEQVKAGADPAQNPAADKFTREQLASRSHALANFSLGVGYFSLNKIEEAKSYFDAAPAGWPPNTGEQVLYLFMAKIAGAYGDLPQARQYLLTALDIDPNYGRAMLGLGQVGYLEANGGCQPGQVQAAGLESALVEYQRAASLADQPELDLVPLKADYYAGRVYHCLSTAGQEDHWETAARLYWSVICQAGEAGILGGSECQQIAPLKDELRNTVTTSLAASAFRELALVEWYQNPGDPAAMQRVELYFLRALELALHEDERALLSTWLSDVYRLQGDCQQAQQMAEQAERLYGDYLQENPSLADPAYEQFQKEVRDDLQRSC
jgi:tetratricopeptide (TPR) repeat protein